MKKKIHNLKIFVFPCSENNYRPSVLDGRFLSYLVLMLIFLKLVTFFYLIVIPRTPYFANIATGLLISMTNEERQISGISPLRISPQLTRAAELKARDMVVNDYFSHWSPQGKSPWHWFELAGYDYHHAGENLAMGFFDAKEVHNAWIASLTHRENIMDPGYREIGIAVVESGHPERSVFFVVQMFGTPRTVVAQTQEPIQETIQEPIQKITQEPIQDFTQESVREPVQEPKELGVIQESDQKDVSVIEEKEEDSILGEYDKGIYFYPAGLTETPSSNFFHFLLVDYDDFVQKATMIVLLFLGFVLVVNVFLHFDVQHPDLIFKGLAFLVLFVLFDYFDQATIIRIFFETPIIN